MQLVRNCKSEGNAVWPASQKTSPYEMMDADVLLEDLHFLVTLMSIEEIRKQFHERLAKRSWR